MKQQFEDGGQQADAAFAALAALNSYNRTNKLATLHELVRRLIDGDEKVPVHLQTSLWAITPRNPCVMLEQKRCAAYPATQELW